VSDGSVTDPEPDLGPEDDDGDRVEPTTPTTLEEAVTALADERKRHSKSRKQAIDRRLKLKEAERRIAELEAAAGDGNEWQQAAIRAMVEAEATRQNARKPELVARLVDVGELDAADPGELRLAIAEQVNGVLDGAPELKRGAEGAIGALSPGPRQRERRPRHESNVNARIRTSLRR
jgi:hypothetical protein